MHKAEINNLVKAYLDNGGRIQKIPTSRIKKHTNLTARILKNYPFFRLKVFMKIIQSQSLFNFDINSNFRI